MSAYEREIAIRDLKNQADRLEEELTHSEYGDRPVTPRGEAQRRHNARVTAIREFGIMVEQLRLNEVSPAVSDQKKVEYILHAQRTYERIPKQAEPADEVEEPAEPVDEVEDLSSASWREWARKWWRAKFGGYKRVRPPRTRNRHPRRSAKRAKRTRLVQ